MLTTLDNGLRVILLENHFAPVVALQMWVNVGSGDDPEEMAGLAHVLEHMVFKGTARRGVGDIAQEIEGAGGDINAWTSFDQTVYHIVMASRFFDRGLDVLADTMQNTAIDAKELKKELGVVLEEIKEGVDAPGKIVSRELFSTAYKRHPYGRPVIGFVETVKSMSKARVERFFRRWYTPKNMVLVVTGDIDQRRALKRIRAAFDRRAEAVEPPPRPEEPRQRRLRVRVKRVATKEAHVGLAFHIPEFVHEDTAALDVAAIVLGQGGASRLARRVRRELQLVTDVYCYAYTPRESGLLIIGATMPPDRVEEAVEAITREVFALAEGEVSSTELRRGQTIIESDAVYQHETVQGQARKLGFFQSVASGLDFEAEYNRRVAAVTPAALREVAGRYLRPGNLSVAVVTSEPAAPLAKRLRAAVDRAEAASSAAPKLARAGQVIKVKLDNGARLVYLRDSTVPLLAIRAVWMGGLRHESAANNGVNNMIASLVTRGTATRTGDEIDAEVEGMAGAIGGFSGRNSFGLRAELLAKHWERGLEILADCVRSATFPKEELERQRREILEEIRGRQDNLVARAMQLFTRTRYRHHPYRFDPLGTESTVRRMTRSQLVRYYRQHFTPGRMVLSVVGDVEPERLVSRFKQLFGHQGRRGAEAPAVAHEPAISAPLTAHESSDKEQAHLVVGFPGVSMRSKDRYALEVIASVLGGQGGRLFVELRDRLGLAYRVSAFSVEGIEPGYFASYVATSPEKVQQALGGIDRELARLRDRPVGARALARVKRYLVGTHEISLQRKSTVASYIAFNETYGLGHQTHLKFAREIMAVTPQDVQRVARRYLSPKRRIVTIVHPEQMSEGARKHLEGILGPGVVTTPDKKP